MRLSIIALALLLPACSYIPMAPSVYKIDIQQGNVVTSDMLSRLKPGMTRSQVRFVLGTPLVTDVFHPDRWDYVYRYQKAGKVTEQHRVTAVFEKDLLLRMEGDVAVEGNASPEVATTPLETKPVLKAE
ncbi:MAG: outer membrane protein assembly factor BamE [Sulfuricella denitrificans]|nr:outer membrane protein assembly factor BamE [Sulfuricella denitrificans]